MFVNTDFYIRTMERFLFLQVFPAKVSNCSVRETQIRNVLLFFPGRTPQCSFKFLTQHWFFTAFSFVARIKICKFVTLVSLNRNWSAFIFSPPLVRQQAFQKNWQRSFHCYELCAHVCLANTYGNSQVQFMQGHQGFQKRNNHNSFLLYKIRLGRYRNQSRVKQNKLRQPCHVFICRSFRKAAVTCILSCPTGEMALLGSGTSTDHSWQMHQGQLAPPKSSWTQTLLWPSSQWCWF